MCMSKISKDSCILSLELAELVKLTLSLQSTWTSPVERIFLRWSRLPWSAAKCSCWSTGISFCITKTIGIFITHYVEHKYKWFKHMFNFFFFTFIYSYHTNTFVIVVFILLPLPPLIFAFFYYFLHALDEFL